MGVSQFELDSFHSFASQAIASGGIVSLEALVGRWRAEQEGAEAIASVRRGVQDADAGRLSDLDEVDARIRSQLGFPARR